MQGDNVEDLGLSGDCPRGRGKEGGSAGGRDGKAKLMS